MRHHFTLEPDTIFLNHGSFGATPRPVLAAANARRQRMEEQPVRFMQQELPHLIESALNSLGEYLGAGEDLVFVPNATAGVNIVATSLAPHLKPGDEILASDHEYGACVNAWETICAQTGAHYIRRPIPLPDDPPPADSPAAHSSHADAGQQIIEHFWRGVTERTRVLFLSHITSPTAQLWPIEEIIRRARARNILTVIDGAHTPGQVPLNLRALGADLYTGNCHKWLCSPKTAAFLHARPEVQPMLRPLVVSWGSAPERQFNTGRDYRDAFVWAGTLDYSPCLAVPDAIRFQEEHNWHNVRARSSQLLDEWLPRLAAAAGMAPIHGPTPGSAALRPPQMAITPLPAHLDAAALKQRLLGEFRIEIPVIRWRDRLFLRVSIQAYNQPSDLHALEVAIRTLCAEAATPTLQQ